MRKFSSVEDYIEIINGDRDPVTGKLYGLFDSTPPIVSLARYDVQILSSMSQATQTGKQLTDRQAELAVKLILKYRKQLEKLDIEVTPMESPKFRLGIRQIDRRRLLYVENDKIILKFPYDTKLISDIRDLAKISQGRWMFDSNARLWRLAITETNVVAAHGFAINHNFEIASDFLNYLNMVLECEKKSYQIKLVEKDNILEITNAPSSLVQAISNLGGFHSSNITTLVDNASIYGYEIDYAIEKKIISKYSPRIFNIMASKEIKFEPNVPDEVVNDIAKYVELTERYPIYVYEPDLSDRLFNNFVLQNFDAAEIYRVKDLKAEIPTVHKKVIYFNKFKAEWNQPIRLLISGQGMMHGGEKSLLLQRAEKIVYFATEVYNMKKQKYEK